jgi:hypothetical protein
MGVIKTLQSDRKRSKNKVGSIIYDLLKSNCVQNKQKRLISFWKNFSQKMGFGF